MSTDKEKCYTLEEAKKRLKNISPEGLKAQNRQQMPFDHCDLYLFFDCVFRELESLKKKGVGIMDKINCPDCRKPMIIKLIGEKTEGKQDFKAFCEPCKKRETGVYDIKRKSWLITNNSLRDVLNR